MVNDDNYHLSGSEQTNLTDGQLQLYTVAITMQYSFNSFYQYRIPHPKVKLYPFFGTESEYFV